MASKVVALGGAALALVMVSSLSVPADARRGGGGGGTRSAEAVREDMPSAEVDARSAEAAGRSAVADTRSVEADVHSAMAGPAFGGGRSFGGRACVRRRTRVQR